MSRIVVLITVTTCSPSRSLRCYAHLMQAADNDFVMSLMFALPWKKLITLVNYAIETLRAAMGPSRAIAWMFSSLIYVKVLGRAQRSWAVSIADHAPKVILLWTEPSADRKYISWYKPFIVLEDYMETSNRGILLVLVEESKKRHICKESS